MNWLLVFLGFSLLVVLHEAGHFVAAKATGMRAEKFFLFFGPALISFKRGETEYGVAAIPLGGFVKISGMNPEEELPPEVESRAYYRQPVWKRIVVTAAGPAVNIVLAFLILFFVAFNFPEAENQVGAIEHGSPAARAGIQPGDKLISVDGKAFAGDSNSLRLQELGKRIASHECRETKPKKGCRASTPAQLVLERDGKQVNLSVYPTYDPTVKRTRVGIEYATRSAAASPGEAASFAWDRVWLVTSGTFHVISHLFESQERKQVSSVVGISDVANQTIDLGVTPSLMLLALVSLSLGLINLLPILPLDGGHIFWSLVEKLRGKPVSVRVIERATVVGFALVAVLMFIGLSNDIGRIGGEGFNVR
jgi:regulator of sigma E protease